jgi:hypothetical protein
MVFGAPPLGSTQTGTDLIGYRPVINREPSRVGSMSTRRTTTGYVDGSVPGTSNLITLLALRLRDRRFGLYGLLVIAEHSAGAAYMSRTPSPSMFDIVSSGRRGRSPWPARPRPPRQRP